MNSLSPIGIVLNLFFSEVVTEFRHLAAPLPDFPRFFQELRFAVFLYEQGNLLHQAVCHRVMRNDCRCADHDHLMRILFVDFGGRNMKPVLQLCCQAFDNHSFFLQAVYPGGASRKVITATVIQYPPSVRLALPSGSAQNRVVFIILAGFPETAAGQIRQLIVAQFVPCFPAGPVYSTCRRNTTKDGSGPEYFIPCCASSLSVAVWRQQVY